MPYSHASTKASPFSLQEGLARLSRGEIFREFSLDTVLSELAEQAGSLTGVERTGIWAYNRDHSELRCLELYQLSTRRHTSGELWRRAQYPQYFDALLRDQGVVADHAAHHPATAGFAEGYLARHGVTARLDTLIYVHGELTGVLCLEQVGHRHPWNSGQRLFAQAMANLVTLALIEFEAGEHRRSAEMLTERFRAVFEASRDALVLVEMPAGVILDVNPAGETLFGYPRAQMIGKLREFLHPPGEDRGWPHARAPLEVSIRRHDGSVVAAEMTGEAAEATQGRQVVLGVYRAKGLFG